jgi:hypothetical protein
MLVKVNSYSDFKNTLTALGGAVGGTVLYADSTGSGGTFYVLTFYNSNGNVHAVEADLPASPSSFSSDWALRNQILRRPEIRV